jgi:probable HAF family extracellular repeat protein
MYSILETQRRLAMIIKRYTILFLVLSIILLGNKVYAKGGPAVGPSIIDLGAFYDGRIAALFSQTQAFGINELGQVVGFSKYAFPYEWMPGEWDTAYVKRAFLWLPRPAYGLPAGLNNLGLLDVDPDEGSESEARGINNVGQVVGWSTVGEWEPYSAFCWSPHPDTGMQGLYPYHGGKPCRAYDINDYGIAVGWSQVVVSPQYWPFTAVAWVNGEVSVVASYESMALSINDSCAIIGSWDPGGYGPTLPYLWYCGDDELPLLPDYNTGVALDINNKFQIVGYMTAAMGIYRACLWEKIEGSWHVIDLGTLPGTQSSEARGISDNSKIVGVSDGYAVLWEKEGGVWKITNLNDLPLPDTTWELLVAEDINKKGQIVGYGKHDDWNRGFRLTLGRSIQPHVPGGPGGPFGSDGSETAIIMDIYPNPFTENTTIKFTIGHNTEITELHVCDVTGRVVKSFNHTVTNQIIWDGTDSTGKKVPAGIYFIRLSINGIGSSIKKIIKLE